MWTNKELIDSCKREVENVIKFQLNSKRYNYLIRNLSVNFDSNTDIQFISRNIEWNERKKIERQSDDYFSTNWYIPLSAKGKLKISNRNTGIVEVFEHLFSLYIDMWFHFDTDKPSFYFDILDESKNLLKEYNEKIWNVIDSEGLKSLLEEKNRFDNKNSAQFFTSITRLEKNRPVPFQDFDMHDDLVMCHQDIVFAIGELYAYKPYISDFTIDSVYMNGKDFFQYFPTFFDKRYLSTCGRIFELLYNYWDKIGDILAPYFAPKILENRIYFGKVIDNISDDYKANQHFNWLKIFKENDYKELNNKRKQIVHYSTMESQILRSYRDNYIDLESLRNKQKEKENFTSYFKMQYKMTIEGFYHSSKLIEMK